MGEPSIEVQSEEYAETLVKRPADPQLPAETPETADGNGDLESRADLQVDSAENHASSRTGETRRTCQPELDLHRLVPLEITSEEKLLKIQDNSQLVFSGRFDAASVCGLLGTLEEADLRALRDHLYAALPDAIPATAGRQLARRNAGSSARLAEDCWSLGFSIVNGALTSRAHSSTLRPAGRFPLEPLPPPSINVSAITNSMEGLVSAQLRLEGSYSGQQRDIARIRAEISELRGLREEMTELRGFREEMTELRGLREEMTELRGLREEMTELRGLREEMTELRGLREEMRGLREEMTELRGLREEMTELRGLHEEMTELRGFREEMTELRGLREEMTELRGLREDVSVLGEFRKNVTEITELRATMAERDTRIAHLEAQVAELLTLESTAPPRQHATTKSRPLASEVASLIDVRELGTSIAAALRAGAGDSDSDTSDDQIWPSLKTGTARRRAVPANGAHARRENPEAGSVTQTATWADTAAISREAAVASAKRRGSRVPLPMLPRPNEVTPLRSRVAGRDQRLPPLLP